MADGQGGNEDKPKIKPGQRHMATTSSLHQKRPGRKMSEYSCFVGK